MTLDQIKLIFKGTLDFVLPQEVKEFTIYVDCKSDGR